MKKNLTMAALLLMTMMHAQSKLNYKSSQYRV
jgi:hypothetical protein